MTNISLTFKNPAPTQEDTETILHLVDKVWHFTIFLVYSDIFKWGQKGCLLATRSESFCYTVAPCYNKPRYNEDPIMTNNIWKHGRITVKFGETNPAIMKSPL